MKKYALRAIIALILLVLVHCGVSYNSFVNNEQAVFKSFGDMQSAYQRRSDLIPNLVSVVKGASEYEKSTLIEVMNARAKATKTTITIKDGEKIPDEQVHAWKQAQSELNNSFSKLLVIVEKYPDLKAQQSFLKLQSLLEGTENRIKVARDEYNDKVNIYNKDILQIPQNIWTWLFNFKTKDYFQSTAGADQAPDIEL